MSAQVVVVADTTPLNYPILIGQFEVLHSLFGEVMIPEAVIKELRHPKAPPAVTAWLHHLPHWLRIVKVAQVDGSIQLGHGENEAISLAIEKHVSIVLMDEFPAPTHSHTRANTPLCPSSPIQIATGKPSSGLETASERGKSNTPGRRPLGCVFTEPTPVSNQDQKRISTPPK
jgi:rRNA-processing protein FCF1